MDIILPHVPAAYPDSSFGGVVEAGNELYQGALGRAGATQNAHGLPRLDIQVYLRQGIFLRIRMVLKRYSFKVHTAVGHLGDRILRRGDLGLLLQHLGNAVDTGQRPGEQ